MWKSAGRVPSLRVLPWHICLKTEEKARQLKKKYDNSFYGAEIQLLYSKGPATRP